MAKDTGATPPVDGVKPGKTTTEFVTWMASTALIILVNFGALTQGEADEVRSLADQIGPWLVLTASIVTEAVLTVKYIAARMALKMQDRRSRT